MIGSMQFSNAGLHRNDVNETVKYDTCHRTDLRSMMQHDVGWEDSGADLAYFSASYNFWLCQDMMFSLQVIFGNCLINYEISCMNSSSGI